MSERTIAKVFHGKLYRLKRARACDWVARPKDFLELMFRHHVDPNGHFYLNSMGNMSDADSLLTALRNAKLFHAVMSDRKIATRALRAADTSTFAGNL